MDQVLLYVEPLKQFVKDSMRLVKRCTKPDLKGKLNRQQPLKPSCLKYLIESTVSFSKWLKVAFIHLEKGTVDLNGATVGTVVWDLICIRSWPILLKCVAHLYTS